MPTAGAMHSHQHVCSMRSGQKVLTPKERESLRIVHRSLKTLEYHSPITPTELKCNVVQSPLVLI